MCNGAAGFTQDQAAEQLPRPPVACSEWENSSAQSPMTSSMSAVDSPHCPSCACHNNTVNPNHASQSINANGNVNIIKIYNNGIVDHHLSSSEDSETEYDIKVT